MAKQNPNKKQRNAEKTRSSRVKVTEEDREEIVQDAAHIPDRDQSFGIDEKRLPSQPVREVREAWSGDDEESIVGRTELPEGPDLSDRIIRSSPNPEFVGQPSYSDEPEGIDAGEPPTRVPLEDSQLLSLEDLSFNELQERAEVLGIPDREGMSREELVLAIRDALSLDTSA